MRKYAPSTCKKQRADLTADSHGLDMAARSIMDKKLSRAAVRCILRDDVETEKKKKKKKKKKRCTLSNDHQDNMSVKRIPP